MWLRAVGWAGADGRTLGVAADASVLAGRAQAVVVVAVVADVVGVAGDAI